MNSLITSPIKILESTSVETAVKDELL
jgi:hypothetical protein